MSNILKNYILFFQTGKNPMWPNKMLIGLEKLTGLGNMLFCGKTKRSLMEISQITIKLGRTHTIKGNHNRELNVKK